ncbi:IS5 family transposase [Ralstonia pseudosolanacearum]|nr:IS5 family transposase [Ralstonia pseudosolanacearum]UWD90276.1 IS5 family transposase [Ralstonia pseudosolanacearum]
MLRPVRPKTKTANATPKCTRPRKATSGISGMKAHIGVDADSGLVHTVVGTAANVNDVTQAHALVHGKEADVFGDAGYQGVDKREETQKLKVRWHVALRPGKRRALDKTTLVGKLADELERVKARIRAKAEHPFRVIKRQFGHLKVRYRGLMKNTQQLHTLFALSNLWMMRERLMREATA